jgi:hypothetical protein
MAAMLNVAALNSEGAFRNGSHPPSQFSHMRLLRRIIYRDFDGKQGNVCLFLVELPLNASELAAILNRVPHDLIAVVTRLPLAADRSFPVQISGNVSVASIAVAGRADRHASVQGKLIAYALCFHPLSHCR